jgi:predicted ATPase
MEDKIKKYVITGGPCSGKTTIIGLLKRKGFSVLEETAREVLRDNKRRKNPKTSLEIEIEIFERQIKKENNLGDALVFLDRSALDGAAYSLLKHGKVPDLVSDYDFRNRYDLVFFLERFPFKKDAIRVEKNDEEAQRIHEMVNQIYLDHGYKPIAVPLLGRRGRVDFILNYIGMDKK